MDHYALRVTTPPTREPVELAEVTLHLRVDGPDEDDYLRGLIAAARAWCEKFQDRAYLRQTLTMRLDRFPCDGPIELPRSPLVSVSSIQYVDGDGDAQTLAADQYQVDAHSEPGRIVPAYGLSWPTTRCQMNAVTIVYLAGYGTTAADVPDGVKHAVKLLVTHWYENRTAVLTGTISKAVEFSLEALLNQDKVY